MMLTVVFLLYPRPSSRSASHGSAPTPEHATRGVAIVTCAVNVADKTQTVVAVDSMKPLARSRAGDRERVVADKAIAQCKEIVGALPGRQVTVGIDSRYQRVRGGGRAIWLAVADQSLANTVPSACTASA